VWREDANGFCTACPIRELSVRPARESEDSCTGEGDMPGRTVGIRMGQRFERIVRVTGSNGGKRSGTGTRSGGEGEGREGEGGRGKGK
jgi:hypothetical protein